MGRLDRRGLTSFCTTGTDHDEDGDDENNNDTDNGGNEGGRVDDDADPLVVT